MKKALVPAVVVIFLAGVIVFQLVGKGQVKCRVCMKFGGQRQCAVARGDDLKEARREAIDSACSMIARGVSNAFACPRERPDEESCSE